MNPRPCATPRTPNASKRPRRAALRTAVCALAALLFSATLALADAAQADDDRGLAASPARHVIVKAVGQGVGAAEAEQDALHNARLIAAKHYAALGGAQALDLSPQGLRIIATHSSLPMGLATVRAVVLVEMRLKALPGPPPAALALPVLRVSVDNASQVAVEANRPCEVMVAVDAGPDSEPEILPGGGGAAYRLAPDKPMRQPLPKTSAPASLRVLACTGGLSAPAVAPTLDEAFAKARAGRSRPATMQGVVSECVEIKSALPAQEGTQLKRSMRQKASQSPVNMTGAAGRESGLPVPNPQNNDRP
jgi:hypothetical protein